MTKAIHGISVVDYAICDQTSFSHILIFIVKEPTYLSDHSPLVTWLCTDTDIRNQDPSPESDTLTRLPKQFMWESDSTPKFKAALQPPNLQMIIHEYLRPRPHVTGDFCIRKFFYADTKISVHT